MNQANTTPAADRVQLNIRDVQTIAYDILLVFDEFCKKHNLSYYLCGGTLLGAVRHKGFIPWDDDVDLFMSRPEYEKLIKICETESFGEDLVFACPENGRFMRPFARIYFTKTEVERKYYIKSSGPHTWLDILPVDGLPEGEDVRKRLYARRNRLNFMNFLTMWKPGTYFRKLMLMYNTVLYPFAMLVGVKRWCGMLDKLGKRVPFETAKTVGCVTAGRYGPGEAMPRDAYEIPATVTFEGREFKTMSCWKEYLTGIYGDYMKLPPESRRQPHLDYTTMSRADFDAFTDKHPELKR